jgi:dipeptidyl aminopeptidase/acylaminoacyl peptidase
VAEQNWSDEDRISITGFSFGALFVPAVFHLAAQNEVNIKYGVIAYGGTDIYSLLNTNMTNLSQPLRTIISFMAATAIRGVEPALHAPYVRGEFLLINGNQDHQIPADSWQELHRLIPEPREIVILNEDHMHPRKTDLTKRLVQMSREWLLEKGVVN